MYLIMVFQLTERSGCFSWLGQFGFISNLGDLGDSMGWLVCFVFQCAVCVWLLCGEAVDWWLRGVSKPCLDIIEPPHVISNNVTF